jgi:fructose-bisphosphate aldolase class 1
LPQVLEEACQAGARAVVVVSGGYSDKSADYILAAYEKWGKSILVVSFGGLSHLAADFLRPMLDIYRIRNP